VTTSLTIADVPNRPCASSWTIRDFHDSDIERAVQLYEDTRELPDSTPLNLAVIRPGRFDLVVPVGPPDDQARLAMWQSAVARTISEDVDLGALVNATRGFTPADLFLAAARAAFSGFARTAQRSSPIPIVTADLLQAIAATRPSLDEEALSRFGAESTIHQRL
jgi:transitional endoplasmic reticulum ATPase